MHDIKKLKSFGIIEAMVASIVIILILTGAVALMANLVKGSTTGASYQEAETIAEEVFSQIEVAKAADKIYFLGPVAGRFPIECFDSSYIKNIASPERDACFSDSASTYDTLLPFYTLGTQESYSADQFDAGSFFQVMQVRNKAVAEDFFKFKTTVNHGGADCVNLNGVRVSWQRCREVIVEVKWQDKNGEQSYKAAERFTDW